LALTGNAISANTGQVTSSGSFISVGILGNVISANISSTPISVSYAINGNTVSANIGSVTITSLVGVSGNIGSVSAGIVVRQAESLTVSLTGNVISATALNSDPYADTGYVDNGYVYDGLYVITSINSSGVNASISAGQIFPPSGLVSGNINKRYNITSYHRNTTIIGQIRTFNVVSPKRKFYCIGI
jgi:hypothetical protein